MDGWMDGQERKTGQSGDTAHTHAAGVYYKKLATADRWDEGQ